MISKFAPDLMLNSTIHDMENSMEISPRPNVDFRKYSIQQPNLENNAVNLSFVDYQEDLIIPPRGSKTPGMERHQSLTAIVEDRRSQKVKPEQELYKFYEYSKLYTILFETLSDYLMLDLRPGIFRNSGFSKSEGPPSIAQPQLLNIVVPVYENFIEEEKPKFLKYFENLTNTAYNSQLFIENDLFLCLVMKEFIKESEKIQKESNIYLVNFFLTRIQKVYY